LYADSKIDKEKLQKSKQRHNTHMQRKTKVVDQRFLLAKVDR